MAYQVVGPRPKRCRLNAMRVSDLADVPKCDVFPCGQHITAKVLKHDGNLLPERGAVYFSNVQAIP
jgi:hypothetical protein